MKPETLHSMHNLIGYVSEEDVQEHRELVQDAITILQAILDGKEIEIETGEDYNDRPSYSIDRKHKWLSEDDAKRLESVLVALDVDGGLKIANTPSIEEMKTAVKKRIQERIAERERAVQSWEEVLAELESEG